MTEIQDLDITVPEMRQDIGMENQLDMSGNPLHSPLDTNTNSIPENETPVLDYSGNPILTPTKTDIPQHDEEKKEEESQESNHMKRIGRTSTFFNLINTLVGAGIVSVPSTFTTCGIGPTVLLLVLSCFLCCVAGVIFVSLQHDFNSKGINELAFRVLGKWGMNAISICLIIFCLSCTIAYLIIGSNQVISWLTLAGLKDMDVMWKRAIVVIVYLVVLPGLVTFPRHLTFLSYMAIPSVLGCVLFVIAMIIKGSQYIVVNGGIEPTVKGIDIGFGIFTVFGVHALTFNLQIVMSPIMAPYNPSVRKRARILGYTFMAAFLIVLLPGLFGYLMFGAETASDVMTSFPDNDIFIIIVRIGLFISVSASYPAIVLSIVGSIGQMIWNESIPEEMPTRHRMILIPIVNIVNVLLAVLLPDIKPILGVGGSLGGCLAGFTFPSLCRLVTRKESLATPKNILHICMTSFGLIAAALCTYSSVVDAIKAFK